MMEEDRDKMKWHYSVKKRRKKTRRKQSWVTAFWKKNKQKNSTTNKKQNKKRDQNRESLKKRTLPFVWTIQNKLPFVWTIQNNVEILGADLLFKRQTVILHKQNNDPPKTNKQTNKQPPNLVAIWFLSCRLDCVLEVGVHVKRAWRLVGGKHTPDAASVMNDLVVVVWVARAWRHSVENTHRMRPVLWTIW